MKTIFLNKLISLLLFLAIIPLSRLSAQNCGAANTIYGMSASDQRTLVRIDTATGLATTIGDVFGGGAAATHPVLQTSAMAVDPTTGIIWFSTRVPANIYSYTPGAANPYGTTTSSFGLSATVNKAAYNPADGNIYFHLGNTINALYRFNPATPTVAPVLIGNLALTGVTTTAASFSGGDIAFDGLGIGTPGDTQLYINLVNSSGVVVATVPVNANGTYSVLNIPEGSFTTQLSSTQGEAGQAAPAQLLPAGWVATGESFTGVNDSVVGGGLAVTAGTSILNYNPALLTIAPGATSAGTGTTTFKYATIDAAGKKDFTPAAYTVTWSIPLPTQLLTFTGSAAKDRGFILDWTSGKEEQLSHFAVERSKDGMVFETIATVTPTGSNSTYHYTDNQVKGRMQYYRLRIVDVDHKEAYSKVLSLSNECGQTLSIYPNPVQDKVRIEGLTAVQTLVQIFNAEGRLMVEQTVKATNTELNIADLADGVYHFLITSEGRSQTMKVIKRK
ncbi:hypothetical protein DBR32_15625 [Taibaiella sp. KBW10]|uniref:T9SS type A sorting domain-containing protein n=1 Tax=Taibaiella sp. KBW10 TaxID=2153357 RepID=UPI000F5AD5B3|nr:T9SS type A sorting domain-containing protein [Taibaiella sp. KBW10]RQO29685.1 hypothetical protein DBR32_15625 [Taibaiella sp. KBW10]